MTIKNKEPEKIFQVSNKGGRGEIILYADIGGWFGITSLEFLQAINDLGNVSQVDLRVSSEGGSVVTAIDIFNAIRRHKATWTAHIDGLALSSASWIVLATNKVIMAENAQYMIHRAKTSAFGTSDELRKTATLIDDIEKTAMVNAYTRKTGLPESEIMNLLNEETWMNAEKALELGFIDEVDGSMEMAAHATLSGRYEFVHPPKTLLAINKASDGDVNTPLLQAAKGRLFDIKSYNHRRK